MIKLGRMQADTVSNHIINIVISAVITSVLTFDIQDPQIQHVAYIVIFLILAIGQDLRLRLIEIFDQAEDITIDE